MSKYIYNYLTEKLNYADQLGGALWDQLEDSIEEGIKKLLYDEDFKKELQANAKNFLNQYMKFQGESSRKLAEELNNF